MHADDMITRPEQAASKLTGSTAGMFVIYEDTTGEDALTLSYVGANNVVDHQTITHSYDGLQLNDQGPHFKFLSDLVHHYAEAREGAPAMLFLSQAQRDLIERVTKAMSTQDAHTRTRRASKDLGDQAQTDKGPHNSAPAPAHFAQPWYHGSFLCCGLLLKSLLELSGRVCPCSFFSPLYCAFSRNTQTHLHTLPHTLTLTHLHLQSPN